MAENLLDGSEFPNNCPIMLLSTDNRLQKKVGAMAIAPASVT